MVRSAKLVKLHVNETELARGIGVDRDRYGARTLVFSVVVFRRGTGVWEDPGVKLLRTMSGAQ